MKRGLLLALVLAGCQTTNPEAQIAADDRQCQSYGVAPGSTAYVQCRGNLDTNRANIKASQNFGTGTGLISRLSQ